MSKLGRKVLEEIEARGLSPRPALYFLAKRWVFWLLAILAVGLAGVSVALGIFGFRDYLDSGGKGLDEMPFDDVAQGIPFLSAAAFLLFVLSAYLAYSRTPLGYRLRASIAVALAAAAGLLSGIALYALDVGPAVHQVLSANIPAYRSYTTIPYDEWRHPELGKLGGEALAVEGTVLRLRDFNGEEWIVDIGEAVIGFEESPVAEGDVAISGEVTGPNRFKARTIDPFD